MRTLFIAEQGSVPIPPEAAISLTEAFRQWRERWRSKMEMFEFFAGKSGGWAVFDTSDETELSQIVMEFPLAQFMVLQAHLTVNGDEALGRLTANITQFMRSMGGADQ